MKSSARRTAPKRIGGGLEFNTYSLGKARVLKRPTTRKEKRALLKRFYPKEGAGGIEKILHGAEESTRYSQRNLKRYVLKMAPWLIGNPVFLKKLEYTQDKVCTLGRYLKLHTYKENKSILKSYVKCILLQWEYGFFQKVSNFSVNYGINEGGRVILIDLGELDFSKRKVARRVRKKMWLFSESYLKFNDNKLKRYYARLLNNELTLEKLDRLWRRKLD